jgi:hypothetical protein
MSAEPAPTYDKRMEAALDELRSIILRRYPMATFETGPSQDDPEIVHLYAYVDVEDTNEVMDLVVDRMVDMQAEEGLPVFVIPLLTPERAAEQWRAYVGQATTSHGL